MSMLTIRRLASGLVRHGGTGSGPISCIVLHGRAKKTNNHFTALITFSHRTVLLQRKKACKTYGQRVTLHNIDKCIANNETTKGKCVQH